MKIRDRLAIPCGTFGYIGTNFCDSCGGFDDDLEYHRTHRQTWFQPEEGIEVCPHCGSRDCGPNEQAHGMKVVRRYSIPKSPNHRSVA